MRRVDRYRLWLGYAGDARDLRRLFDLGIRAVVQLAAEEPPAVTPRELILLRFPLIDGEGNEPVLLRLAVGSIVELLRADVPTLVCCGAGMSRSPALAAAAMAMLERREPDDCLREIASAAPADVSPGLWNELRSRLCFVSKP